MAEKNKKTPTTNLDSEIGQKDSFSNLYASDIVKAFADKMEKKNPNFLPNATKERTIQAFEQFVQEEYDGNILQALKDGKINGNSIDIELNKIADKGFTVDDLLSPVKSSVIKNKLGHMTSEAEAISHGIVQCHKQWQKLTASTKDSLKFDDFLREIGYKSQTDPEGNIISVSPGPKGKSRSLASIATTWKDFVRTNTHNSDDITLFTEMMNFDHFDPTEKVACISAVRGLYHQIETISKGNTQKKQILTDIWLDVFSDDALYNPVGAHMGWTSIDGLERHMADFFQQIATSGVITKKDIEQLKNIAITSKSCALIGEKSGDLPRGLYDEQLKNRRFGDLSQQMQNMVNSLTQIDLVNNISDTIEQVETDIDNYAKVFDIPGNMAHFFDQFGLPSSMEVNKDSHEYKLHHAEYKRKNKELHDFVKAHSGQFQSDNTLQAQREALEQEVQDLQLKINPHGAYLSLKQHKERIKDELSGALDHQKRQELIKKLSDIDIQLNNHKQTTQVSTRDQYLDHISNQVDTSIEVVGSGVIYGEQVVSVLKKLQSKNRDISQLSHPDEQNILMQASINIQLMNVKNSDINTTVGYGFQEYAAFVSGLYDLRTPSQSIIMTQDKEPITLDFTSKKFVGKPLERHNIDVTDVKDLNNIRVEFELDLNNNPDAEEFVRIMTGGNNSQIVEDFIQAPGKNFPKTITDSSFVQMVDKDGNPFEGYLSRYEFPDDENTHDRPEGASPQAENSTYILYSEPADKLSTTREVKTRGPSEQAGKQKPVYINMNNIDDWQSVEIKDKKVTLSDEHLKAFTLGHMISQKTDKNDFLYPKNPSIIQEIIKNNDENYHTKLNKDNRDINQTSQGGENTETLDEQSEKSESSLFLRQRNELVGGGEKPPLCEIGARLILKPKEDAVKSVPDGQQLLSATVKDVKKDNNGNIIGCTFGFDTLSRTGKCTIKDVTLSGGQLSNMKEVFDSVTYLDNIQKDPQDYAMTFERLKSLYSDKKKYNWNLFSDLSFDDKEFAKGKEKVTKFVASKATTDAYGKGNDTYDVEYTIKKSGDKYHITSTPYAADITKKDGEKTVSKKENISFDTVTDLSGMLLILAGKKLKPYTKQDEEEAILSEVSSGIVPEKRHYNRSLSTIRSVLKGGGTKMVEGWKKKLQESGEDELKYVLFNELNVYRRLQNKFGGILEMFDMDFLDDLADEAEGETMPGGFKKVEGQYNQISKFHKSYNYGGKLDGYSGESEDFGTKIGGGQGMCKSNIDNAKAYYDAGKPVPYKDRCKVAGSLWYMIEKFKSGYAGFGLSDPSQYPKGTYVKLLFGQSAYKVFEEKYNKKLSELETATGKTPNQIQEQLMMFEYNFIVDNISGGAMQDTKVRDLDFDETKGGGNGMRNPNAWYFQRMYGREYGNKLRGVLGAMKVVSTDQSSDTVKQLIDGQNFDHIYGEYYEHIKSGRAEEAIQELSAMPYVATTPDQADEVFIAMMTGILNGGLTHGVGKDTREGLKVVFRNCGIPFPHWIEKPDAAKKIIQMLSMATADLGKDSFDEKFAGDNIEAFTSFSLGTKPNITKFTEKFSHRDKNGWLKPGSEVRERVISFLHMDNLKEEDDNNLMKVWKSDKNDLPVIFNRKITIAQKEAVDDMMGELYFNTDRGAKLDNYNYAPGFKHTHTMIENFSKSVVNKTNGSGSFEDGIGDHADTYYECVKETAPNNEKLTSDKKYKLAYYVDEFFRTFGGFGGTGGGLAYNRETIEKFYNYVRIAQETPGLADKDKRRLIWFSIVEKMYSNGALPPLVEQAMSKYLSFFETNLGLFDKDVATLHKVPKNRDEDFGYVFTQDISDYTYMPEHEWIKKGNGRDRLRIHTEDQHNGIENINGMMQQANDKARGFGRNNYNNSKLGMTLDKKINNLSKGVFGKQNNSDDEIKKRLHNNLTIDVVNKDTIDTNLINKPTMKIVKGGGDSEKKTIDPLKNISDDELEEEYQNRYGMTG